MHNLEFLENILSNSFFNLLITVILIPLIYDFIKRKSEQPKLLMDGSSGSLSKDATGKDVYVFGIEIYNSTKFFGYPINRQTASIHGYDLYSSKKKEDYSVHPIFVKAEGEVQLPFELKSVMYNSVDIKFLAYYKNEKEYHIIERINEDGLIVLGADKIKSGSLNLKFVLRDEIWRSYDFNFTPIFINNHLYPLRVKPLRLRYDYFKIAISDLKNRRFKAFLHNFCEIFKISNHP